MKKINKSISNYIRKERRVTEIWLIVKLMQCYPIMKGFEWNFNWHLIDRTTITVDNLYDVRWTKLWWDGKSRRQKVKKKNIKLYKMKGIKTRICWWNTKHSISSAHKISSPCVRIPIYGTTQKTYIVRSSPYSYPHLLIEIIKPKKKKKKKKENWNKNGK